MNDKARLIAFSENKLGGVQSYFYNLLINDKDNLFNKEWILYQDELGNGAKLPAMFDSIPKTIFKLNEGGSESVFSIARRLNKLIGPEEGIVLASFYFELATLHLHRRPNKRIFFFCHDTEYLDDAIRFEFLIDVYVTHNIQFYDQLRKLFPARIDNIFFLPYGIPISGIRRKSNFSGNLKVLILSRITVNKGVYDIPLIENELRQMGVVVDWVIIGNGPELPKLKELFPVSGNVSYFNPDHADEVIKLASACDLYLLPSRVDGLPNALLETMSVGCVPVISEFNSGISEVVTPNEGFVLPVGDIKAFASIIRQLDNERTELEKLSENSALKIAREYNVESRAAEYFKLFNDFKKFKRPHQFRTFKYLGWSHHPAIPNWLKRNFLTK